MTPNKIQMKSSVLAITLAVFLSGETAGSQDRASESRPLVLSGAKIYPAPDVVPIANGVVVVRNQKIAAIGRGLSDSG